jgi:thiamine biosynthesis protein ThiI
MALILLRYGEIGLKGKNRTFFFRKLRNNVRRALKDNQIEGTVWQEGQRIYLETGEVDAALAAVRKVFGLVSLSPVQEAPADLEAIIQEAVRVARQAGLDPDTTFRIKARRADKSFPHISPEIERQAGAAVVAATGAQVDLSNEAAVEIGIEVRPERALIFGQTIPGPGGLPLGSQGRVVALLSSGIDSPVATWLMMKRGCSVIPLHFSTSQAQAEQVQAIVEALNEHAYGWKLKPIILSHQEALAPTLDQLRELGQQRWACLFCKRVMMVKAAEIASQYNAAAIVSGDSLGQVASQTLNNLEVISFGIPKPILRPLIGLDKTEIMALARQIGTYEASIDHAYNCPFLPDRPLTQARMAKFHELLAEMESLDSRERTGAYV